MRWRLEANTLYALGCTNLCLAFLGMLQLIGADVLWGRTAYRVLRSGSLQAFESTLVAVARVLRIVV